MTRLCAALTTMVLLAACAAATPRIPEPAGYWTGDPDAPVPAALHGATVIRTAALVALLAKPGTAVVDVSNGPVRPAQLAPGAAWMPLPHRGLRGAIWLPGAGAGNLPADLDQQYRDRLRLATAGSLDAALVVYCHEACWLSWNAAKRAVAAGYRHVYWYVEGIEGWTAAHQETVSLEAPPQAPALMLLDLELTGDLGGPDFTAEHTARLTSETMRLRRQLAATGRYRLLDNGPVQPDIDALKAQQAYLHDCNGCDLDVGRRLGAELVMVAWVDRVSGLILSLTYELHAVQSGQIAARKSYDFRGDNDNAWNHAIDYMVRDMKAVPTPASE